jgi:hypothetical protein
MKTFYRWLKQYKNQQNAIGDLARDAIEDASCNFYGVAKVLFVVMYPSCYRP